MVDDQKTHIDNTIKVLFIARKEKKMETLPVWKRIYPVVASKNPHVTDDIIEDVIYICKENVTEVFLQYQSYTKKSFLKWKQHPGLKDIVSDDEMCTFICTLSKTLNLDTNVAWRVICNFLIYEYYEKVDELKTLIKFGSKIEFLTENIWYFYSADRMFLLKTLRHILETDGNETNVNFEKLKSFVKEINISQLWRNLIKVFYNLIHEIGKDNIHYVPSQLLIEWINRNNREQLEVLLLMIQIVPSLKITGSELEDILSLFIRHGFTRHPLYAESINISKSEDLSQVKNAEIALILAVMDRYWKSPEVSKKLPQSIEKNLELLQIQGNNSIVMFAWSIFKVSCGSKFENDLEHCNVMIEETVKKKVFWSLYQLMTHRIFSNCKVGDTLINGIYTLILKFSKICADYHYFYEQDGVGKMMSELLKQKGLVVLENLRPIFQVAVDSFPYVFDPFLDMCKSLLSIPEKSESTMNLLKSIPTFLSAVTWSSHQNEYIIGEPLQLFRETQSFIIPKGTLVEKFMYQDMPFSKFHYPFNYFSLLEVFIKTLSTINFEVGPEWSSYKNVTELVLNGFKFIHHILKIYTGNYRNDIELRTLVQRLEIIPTQFWDGSVKNFDLIKLYFCINCTLITKGLLDYMEAFPPIQRKQFMPVITSYNKENRYSLFGQLYKSILYQSLKEEEGNDTHDLLLQYLELIYFMVKNHLYHNDVQLPGIWYMINCIFPLHQQWLYKDPFEKVSITKLCISIFVEILKQHLFKITGDSLIIFEMVIESFYYEDITLSSFMSMFSNDKFYLQNLMESESNWDSGPALKNLECLRLQLVLLLLLYKHKAKSQDKKTILDDNVEYFAKAVTPYVINPYSLALRKLSCRFLELLSRDQNVPLMALLGLDYVQVQRLYLDRLRDSTEDDDLKVYILDLIGTCVVYQHGMTAAFFHVKRSRKWYCDNKEKTIEGDTVCDFMVDYLQNVKKSQKFLEIPLQIGILHVMANLWSSRKRHLIDEVVNLNEFWPLLSNPLFSEFNQLPKVYAYIFHIYGIQLIETENDPKFLSAIDKFVTDKKQINNWIQYIWKIFKEATPNIEDIEDRQFLLKSWMEFVIMLEKTKELKKFDTENKFEFISMTLDAVALPLVNTYCMKLWMNLVLLQISYWKIFSKQNSQVLAEKAINSLIIVKSCYRDLEKSARLAVLTSIQQILENLHEYFQSSSQHLMDLLEQFGAMLDFEYSIVVKQKWKNTNDVFDTSIREQLLPWMICVRIVSGLFELKNIEEVSSWFTSRNLIKRFMDCTTELIHYSATLPLAKVLLYCLTLYACSPLSMDFLNVNVSNFFMKIEGPIATLLFGHNNKISPLQLEEGWITCSLLIKFQTAYFKSLQYESLPSCFNFVILSQYILPHIFNILETTVALKALDVVINTLVLFDSILVKWNLEWYRKSNTTYNFVLNGVKKIVNSCIYAILRPKNVIVYILDESNRLNQMDKHPVQLMVAIVNRLVTAVGIGFSILYRINPGLTNLLNPCLPEIVTLLIENDFNVPNFELPISNKLTYGMLLCLTHFLCKTLDTLKLNKKQTSSVSTSEYFSKCFGVVEHQSADNLPTQQLGAFLRNATYEYSGMADPWIQRLDYDCVKNSLEFLMLLLAQQVFLVAKVVPSDTETYFKRNLSSELQFFYEHVKKITSILISSTTPSQFSPASRAETDILRRYLLHYKETNRFNEIVDHNFCIIMAYWFTNICNLN